MIRYLAAGLALLGLLAATDASAQAPATVKICVVSGSTCTPVTATNPLPVNATVSASVTGWPGTTQTTGTPIAVTTGGVTGTLPSGAVVLATNDGSTNTAYCKLGASATTSDTPVYPHSSVSFTVGSNTQLTCITSTSTTTVNMSGGAGLPTGWGGGSASGGGGGTSSNFGSAFPSAGTAVGASDGTNMQALRVTAWGTAPTGLNSLAVNANVLASVLPTGASTSANQTTSIGILNGVAQTTAHGCSVAGYGVLGCLGQIDDDIKGPIPSQSPAVPIGGVSICDGANGSTNPCTTPATVKAASTPAAATDKAVVVDQRPGTILDQNLKTIAGSTVVADPCQVNTSTYTPINISASGSTKIITGTSAKKTYICHIDIVTNAANNVALIEGTVTNCGTGTAGMAGGTTAASGWNFSANGGISLGMGGSAVLASATNADDVCLITSASTQLSGVAKWVQQ